jgi:hypothetical protein
VHEYTLGVAASDARKEAHKMGLFATAGDEAICTGGEEGGVSGGGGGGGGDGGGGASSASDEAAAPEPPRGEPPPNLNPLLSALSLHASGVSKRAWQDFFEKLRDCVFIPPPPSSIRAPTSAGNSPTAPSAAAAGAAAAAGGGAGGPATPPPPPPPLLLLLQGRGPQRSWRASGCSSTVSSLRAVPIGGGRLLGP